jgi:hypothetical protein
MADRKFEVAETLRKCKSSGISVVLLIVQRRILIGEIFGDNNLNQTFFQKLARIGNRLFLGSSADSRNPRRGASNNLISCKMVACDSIRTPHHTLVETEQYATQALRH